MQWEARTAETLAQALLTYGIRTDAEARLQYTIEARELSNDSSHRASRETRASSTTIEAQSPDDAISRFVSENRSELVSIIRPARGVESIATVKKDDSVYLIRVYAA